jgi:peptidoglycan/LPS O-acetylase OafA/YrhL
MEQELRLSLLFPLLLWALSRCRPGLVMVASAGLIVLGTSLTLNTTSWAWTAVPVGCFVLGMLMARHQGTLRQGWARAGRWGRRALLAVAGLCFWLPYAPQPNVLARAELLRLVPTLGACVLLVAALCGSRTAWLRGRLCQWLGRISYSVYVWHAVVLAGIVRALPGGVAPFALAPVGIGLTLLVGHLSYRYVERPAVAWGRRQLSVRRTPLAAGWVAALHGAQWPHLARGAALGGGGLAGELGDRALERADPAGQALERVRHRIR